MNVIELGKDEDQYEEMLNEIYEEVEICGMTFSAGRALRLLDETAFRCGMSDEPIRYQCGECSAEFEEDEQDKAEECCKTECEFCGEKLQHIEGHTPHCPDNETKQGDK